MSNLSSHGRKSTFGVFFFLKKKLTQGLIQYIFTRKKKNYTPSLHLVTIKKKIADNLK